MPKFNWWMILAVSLAVLVIAGLIFWRLVRNSSFPELWKKCWKENSCKARFLFAVLFFGIALVSSWCAAIAIMALLARNALPHGIL